MVISMKMNLANIIYWINNSFFPLAIDCKVNEKKYILALNFIELKGLYSSSIEYLRPNSIHMKTIVL
jgi:hypothetical protein